MTAGLETHYMLAQKCLYLSKVVISNKLSVLEGAAEKNWINFNNLRNRVKEKIKLRCGRKNILKNCSSAEILNTSIVWMA